MEKLQTTIELSGTDVDGDDLEYSATSDSPQDVSVNLVGNLLSLIPNQDYNGEVIVNVVVSDLEYSVNEIFSLTVLPVNDAPMINLPESFSLLEDESSTIDFTNFISDIDEDDLSLSYTGDENINIDITEFDVEFTVSPNWFGEKT